MKRPVFIAGILAALLVGCGDGTTRNTVTLSLSFVDGQPLPVTLPSTTGTVEVLSGILIGSRFGVECEWVVNLSGGSSPTGVVTNCAIGPTSTVTLDLDLASSGGPTGTHSYRFGLQ